MAFSAWTTEHTMGAPTPWNAAQRQKWATWWDCKGMMLRSSLETNIKWLYTVWFYLHNSFEMAQSQRWRTGHWVWRAWRWGQRGGVRAGGRSYQRAAGGPLWGWGHSASWLRIYTHLHVTESHTHTPGGWIQANGEAWTRRVSYCCFVNASSIPGCGTAGHFVKTSLLLGPSQWYMKSLCILSLKCVRVYDHLKINSFISKAPLLKAQRKPHSGTRESSFRVAVLPMSLGTRARFGPEFPQHAARQDQSEGRGSLREAADEDDWVTEWVDQGGRAGCGGPGVEASEHASAVTTYRPFLNTPPAECWSFRLRAMRSVKTSTGTWEQACDSPPTPSGAGFFKRQLWTFRMHGTRLHGPIIRAQPQRLLLGQGALRV